MDTSTLKKASFIAGIIVFILVILGFLKYDDFYFDEYLFDFKGNGLIPFSVLSLFASALMVFGMKTTDAITTLKRCKTGAIIGGFFWLWIVVALFVNTDYDGIYFVNWLLLCTSASALIVFAIKYTLKKEK